MGHNKNKIIHYDLKPHNIMIHKGEIKICEEVSNIELPNKLGVFLNQTRKISDQGVGIHLYLPYLPPEHNYNNHKISPKVDIWSVGVIFYEMLFGKRPCSVF